MGLCAGKSDNAWHRADACWQAGRRAAATSGLVCLVLLSCLTRAAADPQTIRIATYSAAFSRDGPGLLLRDLIRGDDQTDGAVAVIADTAPDILLLTEFDYDARLHALHALQNRLAEAGLSLPHAFALRPNTGIRTALDLNGNGRIGESADAQGFGRFGGDGGMALLSRWPVDAEAVQDFSALLWRDLPEERAGPILTPQIGAVQRLSTTAHWMVPIKMPQQRLILMAFAATAPVFDGPERRNDRRNADEISLWQQVLDGKIGTAPTAPFVILGRFNLDPVDGEGLHSAIHSLIAHPALQDPRPSSDGARAAADPDHNGPPELDTADWDRPSPGNLRVDYVLPSAELEVKGSGVVWPVQTDPLAPAAHNAGPHKLVWIDVVPDRAPE